MDRIDNFIKASCDIHYHTNIQLQWVSLECNAFSFTSHGTLVHTINHNFKMSKLRPRELICPRSYYCQL